MGSGVRSSGRFFRLSGVFSLTLALLFPASLRAEGGCVDAARLMKEAVELGDNSEAEERKYREAIAACPNMAEAHHNLAVVLHRRGNRVEARSEIDAAITLSDAAPFRLTRAGICLDAGELQSALDDYQNVLLKKPQPSDSDRARALQGAAFSLEKMGRREEAEKIIAEWAAVSTNPSTVYLHAVLLAKLGREEEAVAAYQRTVQLDPNHLEALQFLGVALVRRGSFEGAIRVLSRAAELKANDPTILAALGSAYEGLGDFDKAAIYLSKARERAPDNTGLVINLALVLMQRKQEGQAEELLQGVVAREPNNSRALTALGWARLELGRYAEAETSLRAAIEHDATSALAHYNLGVLWQRLGRNEEAAQEFRAALTFNPAMTAATKALAVLGKT